jgi:formylglycine-generating enzyme required for sulfatase activity
MVSKSPPAPAAKLVISRQQSQAQYFPEDLGNGIKLNMVLIPGGSFLMGAPETEERSSSDERPQHPVNISPFLIGQYPITQKQWQAVAALPKINRELKPNPSYFKGDNLPVESISWYEAVEFCDRLSEYTNRPYRLPSEAEWEYVCRAGTTTPFHFGETITTDLANYRGTDWEWEGKTYPGFYGKGPRGSYREKTTPVGSFDAANAFGLYDIHGNVWEWCSDHWHKNYEGAPIDGSAWLSQDENENHYRVLRGGSFNDNPEVCRSAFRSRLNPDNAYNVIGVRVACAAARTQ